MCGIAGVFNLDTTPVNTSIVEKMTQVIKHRGPDDEGYLLANTKEKKYELAGGRDTPGAVWTSPTSFSPRCKLDSTGTATISFDLAFGHRRLAIFDPLPTGHQPMCNSDGTIWITYNGEIYNYIELRQELRNKGHQFISNSDTEVLIRAYEEWGYECLNKLNGVWAFALWDMKIDTLFCARDRFGVKPLYYYFDGSSFVFASEIKAILEHPEVPKIPNEEAIYNYLLWARQLDKPDDTCFKGIKELGPSSYLVVSRNSGLHIKTWWSLKMTSELGNFSTNDTNSAAQHFLTLLEDSITLRLRGDAPIGALLSGGLDSSSVVCITNRLILNEVIHNRQLIGERVRTFSSCFDDDSCDERIFIDTVLQKTMAEKNYVFPDGDKLWQELPLLIWHQDEPFLGTELYSQWSALKKAHTMGVKVLLDGQGGDESLAGYPRHWGAFLLNLILKGRIPRFLRESKGMMTNIGMRSLTSILMTAFGTIILQTLPVSAQSANMNLLLGLRKRKAHALLNYSFNKRFSKCGLAAFKEHSRTATNLQRSLYRDVLTYLPLLLRYGDRDSMALSVETRVPFLDHRLVEYLFSLPASLKIRDGWTKWILRQAMEGILPQEVRSRTDKKGTPTPQRKWLWQNRENIRSLFASRNCLSGDYINPAAITDNLDSLLSRLATTREIWRCINLELWLQVFFSGKTEQGDN